MVSNLRYPIGPFQLVEPVAPAIIRECLLEMTETPEWIRAAVLGLSSGQLDTPYRTDGWTVRQVVHHLADAQMNWYIRIRLALTEEQPTVKPYPEQTWAELPDAKDGPIEPSLLLIDNLYARLSLLFAASEPYIWKRTLIHPERGVLALGAVLTMFAWHGRHHTAHITELRKRMGW